MPLEFIKGDKAFEFIKDDKPFFRDFVNLCCDSFASQHPLKGNTIEHLIQYPLDFFKNIDQFIDLYFQEKGAINTLDKDHPLRKLRRERQKICKVVSGSTTYLSCRESVLDKVLKLQEGDSLFLEGGWEAKPTSKSGHAMLYQFIRVSNTQFEFRVINTGSGVRRYHQSVWKKNQKTGAYHAGQLLFHPLTYTFDESVLRAPDVEMQFDSFIAALTLQNRPGHVNKYNQDQDECSYLYENIIPIIGMLGIRKQETSSPKKRIYRNHLQKTFDIAPIKSQHSGTCAGRGVEQILRNYLKKDAYYWFKFLLSYGLCQEFVSRITDQQRERRINDCLNEHGFILEQQSRIRLVRGVIKNLSRYGMFKKKDVSPKQFGVCTDVSPKQFGVRMETLLNRIKTLEEELKQQNIQRVPIVLPDITHENLLFFHTASLDKYASVGLPTTEPPSLPTERPYIAKRDEEKEEKEENGTPLQCVKKILDELGSEKRKTVWDPYTATRAIENTIFSLCQKSDKALQFSKIDQLHLGIKNLETLMETYKKYSIVCTQKRTLTPTQCVTLFSFLFLMTRLSKANASIMSTYFHTCVPFFLKHLIESNANGYLCTGSPEHDRMLHYILMQLNEKHRTAPDKVYSDQLVSNKIRTTYLDYFYFESYYNLEKRLLTKEEIETLDNYPPSFSKKEYARLDAVPLVRSYLRCRQMRLKEKPETLPTALQIHTRMEAMLASGLSYVAEKEEKREFSVREYAGNNLFVRPHTHPICHNCPLKVKSSMQTFRGTLTEEDKFIVSGFRKVLLDTSSSSRLILRVDDGIEHSYHQEQLPLSPSHLNTTLLQQGQCRYDRRKAMEKKLLATKVSPRNQALSTITLFAEDHPDFFLHYSKVLEINLFHKYFFFNALKQDGSRTLNMLHAFLEKTAARYYCYTDPMPLLNAVRLAVLSSQYALHAIHTFPNDFQEQQRDVMRQRIMQSLCKLKKTITLTIQVKQGSTTFPHGTLSAYYAMIAALQVIYGPSDALNTHFETFLEHHLRYIKNDLLTEQDTEALHATRQAILTRLFKKIAVYQKNGKLDTHILTRKLRAHGLMKSNEVCRLDYKTVFIGPSDKLDRGRIRIHLETGHKTSDGPLKNVLAPRTLKQNPDFQACFTQAVTLPLGELSEMTGIFRFVRHQRTYRFNKAPKLEWGEARLQCNFGNVLKAPTDCWFQHIREKQAKRLLADWGTHLLPLVHDNSSFWQDKKGNIMITQGPHQQARYYFNAHEVSFYAIENNTVKNNYPLVKASHPGIALFENDHFIYRRYTKNRKYQYSLPRYDLNILFSFTAKQEDKNKKSQTDTVKQYDCEIKEKNGKYQAGVLSTTPKALPYVGFMFTPSSTEKKRYYVPVQSHCWRSLKYQVAPKACPNGLYPPYLFELEKNKNEKEKTPLEKILPIKTDNKSRYFVYQVDKNNRITFETAESGLYLVYLYLMEGRYETANQYLYRLRQKTLPLNAAVIGMIARLLEDNLDDNVSGPPMTLELLTLRLQVLSCLIDALAFSSTFVWPLQYKEMKEKLAETTWGLYSKYLNISNKRSINSVYLPKRAELSIANYLYHNSTPGSNIHFIVQQQCHWLKGESSPTLSALFPSCGPLQDEAGNQRFRGYCFKPKYWQDYSRQQIKQCFDRAKLPQKQHCLDAMKALLSRNGDVIRTHLPVLFAIKERDCFQFKADLMRIIKKEYALILQRKVNAHPVSIACFLLKHSTLKDYQSGLLTLRTSSENHTNFVNLFEKVYQRCPLPAQQRGRVLESPLFQVEEEKEEKKKENNVPTNTPSLQTLFSSRHHLLTTNPEVLKKSQLLLPCNGAVQNVRKQIANHESIVKKYRFFENLALAIKGRHLPDLEKLQGELNTLQIDGKSAFNLTLTALIADITFAHTFEKIQENCSNKIYKNKNQFHKAVNELIKQLPQHAQNTATQKLNMACKEPDCDSRTLRRQLRDCFISFGDWNARIDKKGGKLLYDMIKRKQAFAPTVTHGRFMQALKNEVVRLEEEKDTLKKRMQQIWNEYKIRSDRLQQSGWDEGRRFSMSWLTLQWHNDGLHTVCQRYNITKEHRNSLNWCILNHLRCKTEQNHIKRIGQKYTADHPKHNTGDTVSLSAGCFKEVMQDNLCQYNHALDRLLLYFQSKKNLLVRKEQLAAIWRMVLHQGTGNIQQLLMGAGKSSVIVLFVSLLQSKLNKKMMLSCVPKELIEDNSFVIDYQRLTGKKVHKFLFDRHFTGSYTELLSNLRIAHQYGEALVTTSGALFSLMLKLLEVLDASPSPTQQVTVSAIVSIIHLFDKSGFILVDEIHNEFRANLDLNYGLSDLKPIDTGLINGMTDLLTAFSVYSKKQQSKKQSQRNNNAPPPTFADFLRDLAEEKRTNTFKTGLLNDIERVTGNPEPLSLLISHLNGKVDPKKSAVWIRQLSKEAKTWLKLLMLMGDTHRGLFHKLKTVFHGEHYGLSGLALAQETQPISQLIAQRGTGNLPLVNYIAVPYAGVNSPKSKSQFADIDRVLTYTAMTFFETCLPKGVFIYFLQEVQKKGILLEGDEYASYNAQFRNLCGLNEKYVPNVEEEQKEPEEPKEDPFSLASLSLKTLNWEEEKRLEALYERVKNRPELIRYCLKEYLYPSYRIQTDLLSMNGSKCMGILKGIRGMTGTPDNHLTISPDITLHRETGGVKGLIGAALLDKSKGNSVVSMPYKKARALPIKDLFKGHSEVRCVVDAGAFFKDIPTTTLIGNFCEYIKSDDKLKGIKWIIFFKKVEEEGRLVDAPFARPVGGKEEDDQRLDSLKADHLQSALGAQPGEWFAYLDEIHKTGVDITHPDNAKLVVTARWDTLLTHFLQAVMRGRKVVDGKQSVRILYAGEKEKDRPNTVASVLEILEKNQKNHLEKIHSAAPSELALSHEYALRYRQLMKIKDEKKRVEFYEKHKHTFFMKAKTGLSTRLLYPSQSLPLSECYLRLSEKLKTNIIAPQYMDPVLDRGKENIHVFTGQDTTLVMQQGQDREVVQQQEKENQSEVEQEKQIKTIQPSRYRSVIIERTYVIHDNIAKNFVKNTEDQTRPFSWMQLLKADTVLDWMLPFQWEGIYLTPRLLQTCIEDRDRFHEQCQSPTSPPYDVRPYLENRPESVQLASGVLIFQDRKQTERMHACFINGMEKEFLMSLLSDKKSLNKYGRGLHFSLLSEHGHVLLGQDFSKGCGAKKADFVHDVKRKLAFYNGNMTALSQMEQPYFKPSDKRFKEEEEGYIQYYQRIFQPMRLEPVSKKLQLGPILKNSVNIILLEAIRTENVDITALKLDKGIHSHMFTLQNALNAFYHAQRTAKSCQDIASKRDKVVTILKSYGIDAAYGWARTFKNLHHANQFAYSAILKGQYNDITVPVEKCDFKRFHYFFAKHTIDKTRLHDAIRFNRAFFEEIHQNVTGTPDAYLATLLHRYPHAHEYLLHHAETLKKCFLRFKMQCNSFLTCFKKTNNKESAMEAAKLKLEPSVNGMEWEPLEPMMQRALARFSQSVSSPNLLNNEDTRAHFQQNYHEWLYTHLLITCPETFPVSEDNKHLIAFTGITVKLEDTQLSDWIKKQFPEANTSSRSALITTLKEQYDLLLSDISKQLRLDLQQALYASDAPTISVHNTHPVFTRFTKMAKRSLRERLATCSQRMDILRNRVVPPIDKGIDEAVPYLKALPYLADRAFYQALSMQLETGTCQLPIACLEENKACFWSQLLQCTHTTGLLNVNNGPLSDLLTQYRNTLIDNLHIHLTDAKTDLSKERFILHWQHSQSAFDKLFQEVCARLQLDEEDLRMQSFKEQAQRAHDAQHASMQTSIRNCIRDFLNTLMQHPPNHDENFSQYKTRVSLFDSPSWEVNVMDKTRTLEFIFNSNKIACSYTRFTKNWFNTKTACGLIATVLLAIAGVCALSHFQIIALPYWGYLPIHMTLIVAGASVALSLLGGVLCMTYFRQQLFSSFDRIRANTLSPSIIHTPRVGKLESHDINQVAIDYFTLNDNIDSDVSHDKNAPTLH